MFNVYSPSAVCRTGMPAMLVTIVCSTAGSFTCASIDATGYLPSMLIPEKESRKSPSKGSITCLTIGFAISMP